MKMNGSYKHDTVVLLFLTACISSTLTRVVSQSVTESECTEYPCTNKGGRTVASCDTSIDYFPIKASPDHSAGWDLEYYNYYKVLTAGYGNYVLVQDGCPTPPAKDIPTDAKIVTIPVPAVAIMSSNYLSFMEIIGERDAVVSMNGLYTSSPCVNELIEEGSITNLNADCNGAVVQFGSSFYYNCPNATVVEVQEWEEKTNLGKYEWIEYLAVFMNKEKHIEQYVRTTEADLSCLEGAVNLHVADRRQRSLYQRKVLWASPNNLDSRAWSQFGVTGNYYGEAIKAMGGIFVNERPQIVEFANRVAYMVGAGQIAAGTVYAEGVITTTADPELMVDDLVELYDTFTYSSLIYVVKEVLTSTTLTVSHTKGGALVSDPGPVPGKCGGSLYGGCVIRKAVSAEELSEALFDVEVIISVPNYNLTATLCGAAFASLADSVPAKANKEIFDYGRGMDPNKGFDFLTSRDANPGEFYEEIATLIYPEMAFKETSEFLWFRNVYSDEACEAPVIPTTASLADACVSVDQPFDSKSVYSCSDSTTNSDSSDSGDNNTPFWVWLLVAVIAVLVLTGVSYSALRSQSLFSENEKLKETLMKYQAINSSDEVGGEEGEEGGGGGGGGGVEGGVSLRVLAEVDTIV